ncbi:MAG: hypothetical protein AVDCRST_MAG77-5301, partial [uncultured Chloroflexi bacterium]
AALPPRAAPLLPAGAGHDRDRVAVRPDHEHHGRVAGNSAPLQLRRDQPVVGVSGEKLPLRLLRRGTADGVGARGEALVPGAHHPAHAEQRAGGRVPRRPGVADGAATHHPRRRPAVAHRWGRGGDTARHRPVDGRGLGHVPDVCLAGDGAVRVRREPVGGRAAAAGHRAGPSHEATGCLPHGRLACPRHRCSRTVPTSRTGGKPAATTSASCTGSWSSGGSPGAAPLWCRRSPPGGHPAPTANHAVAGGPAGGACACAGCACWL